MPTLYSPLFPNLTPPGHKIFGFDNRNVCAAAVAIWLRMAKHERMIEIPPQMGEALHLQERYVRTFIDYQYETSQNHDYYYLLAQCGLHVISSRKFFHSEGNWRVVFRGVANSPGAYYCSMDSRDSGHIFGFVITGGAYYFFDPNIGLYRCDEAYGFYIWNAAYLGQAYRNSSFSDCIIMRCA
jgi:hypothetical protein